ncbi:short neuropeptide F-like [Diachasmimorpha longicaudata]|uniref:short neuropeptide F-like n=1 Tax=Diachasmimorpha longicaudata TaxID=58733 RepID=UPI0030B8FB1F
MMKYYGVTVIALFFVFGVAVSTENYMDYIADENADRDLEGLREFYRFLLRRNSMDNSYPSGSNIGGSSLVGLPYEHLMIRKSQRSPSLRLRFGRSGSAMPPEGMVTRLGSSSSGTEDN